jgi:hypothetical protein
MNLEEYELENVKNEEEFIAAFRKMMEVEVKGVKIIANLKERLKPSPELPCGFVYTENMKWYLVGYTDRCKAVYVSGLKPWAKPVTFLYDKWSRRKWKVSVLYHNVFSRLRKLKDFPDGVASIHNFEESRQCLFTCAYLLGGRVVKRLVKIEIALLKHLMQDMNLLTTTCKNLNLRPKLEDLVEYVENCYTMEFKIENKQGYYESGILKCLEDKIREWSIIEKKIQENGGNR